MEITKACIVAFMKARISLVAWWRKTLVKALAKHQKVAHGWPSITWTSWKGNDMLYYCYIIKNRLDIQLVKQILLEMVTGQQMKGEGYDQN